MLWSPAYRKSIVGATESLIDVYTPSDALDDMRALDSAIGDLSASINGSSLAQPFKDKFNQFFSDWQTFYADNAKGIGAWFSRGRYAFKKRLESYQAELDKWREAFVKAGGVPPSEPERRVDPSKTPVNKVLLYGGLAVVGLYFVTKLWRSRATDSYEPAWLAERGR